MHHVPQSLKWRTSASLALMFASAAYACSGGFSSNNAPGSGGAPGAGTSGSGGTLNGQNGGGAGGAMTSGGGAGGAAPGSGGVGGALVPGGAGGTLGASGAAGVPSEAGNGGAPVGVAGVPGVGGESAAGGNGVGEAAVSFFITSTGNPTGNLGGLAGADAKCQAAATSAGYGDRMWVAYLSVENGPNNAAVNAGDRIGAGPWYNTAGVLLASNLTELHALEGNYELFLDENGDPVPGQWEGSPSPNAHDILTGTNRDGTVNPGYTCADWTSESADLTAWVGHTDGLGPGGSDEANYRPWNAVHENGGCNDTVPRGGAGRIACFAP